MWNCRRFMSDCNWNTIIRRFLDSILLSFAVLAGVDYVSVKWLCLGEIIFCSVCSWLYWRGLQNLPLYFDVYRLLEIIIFIYSKSHVLSLINRIYILSRGISANMIFVSDYIPINCEFSEMFFKSCESVLCIYSSSLPCAYVYPILAIFLDMIALLLWITRW